MISLIEWSNITLSSWNFYYTNSKISVQKCNTSFYTKLHKNKYFFIGNTMLNEEFSRAEFF